MISISILIELTFRFVSIQCHTIIWFGAENLLIASVHAPNNALHQTAYFHKNGNFYGNQTFIMRFDSIRMHCIPVREWKSCLFLFRSCANWVDVWKRAVRTVQWTVKNPPAEMDPRLQNWSQTKMFWCCRQMQTNRSHRISKFTSKDSFASCM